MTSRLDVAVGATTLTEPFDVTWNESLNRPGSFSFSITNDDPQRNAAAVLGGVVTITKDGADVFYGVVESIRQTDADDDEVAVTVVSGRSSIAELERVAVFPPLWPATGVGQAAGHNVSVSPWDSSRLLGWPDPTIAGQLLVDADGADNVTQITDDRPQGWPDPGAYWIGDSSGADEVYLAAQIQGADQDGNRLDLFVAARDELELYHQGVLVLRISAADADPTKTHHVSVVVTPGVPQVFCARVRRVASTNALFALTAHDPDSYEPTKFFFKTLSPDQTWGMFPDPVTPPGTTPGEIVDKLITEYEERRGSLGWTLNFDADLDSRGDAWPTIPIFVCQIGESLIDVLERLTAWVDFGVEVDAGARVLSMWLADGVTGPDGTGTGRGASSGVTIAVGTNALQLVHEVTS